MRLPITNNSVIAYKWVAKVSALMMVIGLLAWPIQISKAALAGDMDLTFGSAGIALTDFGGSDTAWAMVIQPDGRIVSAGQAVAGGNYDFALARHNADGTLDTSFGNGGTTSAHYAFVDQAFDVALQPDGKIVSVGRTDFLGDEFLFTWKWLMTRHNSDGSLDTSFGNNGFVMTDMGYADDEAYAVAVQPDSKIVVGGYVEVPTGLSFGLARYNGDGSLDSSFGSGGKVILPGLGGLVVDFLKDILIKPDGKILAAGSTRLSWEESDFLLVQFNTDGSVDPSFGINGAVMTDFNAVVDSAYSIALQPDDKIVLAGRSAVIGRPSERFAVARYNSDGSIDSNFGSNGRVITTFSGEGFANSVAIASDGKIIVVGNIFGPALAVARYTSEGLLDPSFGSGGKMITVAPDPFHGWAMRLQTDDKIVIAGNTRYGGDFALLRYESVSTPDALIGRTTTLVNSLNLPDGTSNSLNSKLNDALAYVLAGNDAAACSSLQDFINHVHAQTGKKISESQAQELINAANEISSSIGCQ